MYPNTNLGRRKSLHRFADRPRKAHWNNTSTADQILSDGFIC